MTALPDDPWPTSADELRLRQRRLAEDADRLREERPWTPPEGYLVGGCFVAFARGEAGPGAPGDRAWSAAAVWQPSASGSTRHGDQQLRGMPMGQRPRRAADVVAQHVVSQRVPAAYEPGLLALREGPVLAAAVDGLEVRPHVLLVDATGVDHPRRAGLAIHLGAACELPTIGVTHRGLTVREAPPDIGYRGASAPVVIGGETVAAWVFTRTRARPLLVHPGWRTDLDTARQVVVSASTEDARTPVPLKEARRAAREARALAGAT